MNFESLDNWLDDVAPQVPGCTTFTIQDALRASAIEFCRKAEVSVETHEELDIDADERLIVVPSAGTHVRVQNLLWAETTQGSLTIVDRRSIGERGARVNGGRSQRWPKFLFRQSFNEYLFDPVPSESHASALTMHVSYIPKPDAEKVDRVLWQEYREAVAAGALSRLLGQAGQPWTNLDAWKKNEAEFRYQINNARARSAKDFNAGSQHMVLRPLA